MNSGFKVALAAYRPEPWTIPAWFVERLRTEFPQCTFVALSHTDQVAAEIIDAEVYFSWTLRPELFVQARKLRWIHSPAAAVNQLLCPEMVASSVQITNSSEVHGPVVAQHVIALMFALARRLDAASRLQLQAGWSKQFQLWEEQPRPREVAAATLGLVGLGSIGREVARLAKAVGMRVIAIRERPERGCESADEVRGTSAIPWLLAQSDFVVLAAPLTGATSCLMNAETLKLMRRDAYLINVSRGALIDEGDLCQALNEGIIGGAALDVFAVEPLPADSPLWRARNLLITPHSGSMTERQWDRQYALFSSNLRHLLKGEPLEALVDKSRGY